MSPPWENSAGMSFKDLPAGKFTMGSAALEAGREDNEAQLSVTLSEAFSIGVTEVTQSQYEQVVGRNPSRFKGANNPVENVSWDDAIEFCRLLSALPAEQAAGRKYRLPTEAEWEYACRAGTTTAYSFGDDVSQLGKFAWFGGNSGKTTHVVGTKLSNPWGLFDMHGNAWEWCGDKNGPLRVIRGGCWFNDAANCRAANRFTIDPKRRPHIRSFRLALGPSGQ